MRDEFLEPMPEKACDVTLLFGRTPVSGYIVAETEEGYCIGIPGIESYEGDPRLTMATEDEVFSVKLVLQEPYLDGYYFWLLRINNPEQPNDTLDRKEHLTSWTSRYRLTGIVAATLAICVVIPSNSNSNLYLSLNSLTKELLSWSSSIASKEVTAEIADNEIAATLNLIRKYQNKPENTNNSKPLISSASHSSPSATHSSPSATHPTELVVKDPTPQKAIPDKPFPAKKEKSTSSLNHLLEAGQVGRTQVLTKSLLPWLYGPGWNDDRQSVWISDAARQDLQQFEAGLRGLPRKASADAMSSLRNTLRLAYSDISKAKRVSSAPNIFVISSDDANIFFTEVRGRTELVRVLPIDLKMSGGS